MSKPLLIDLFCGLGGWSRAFLDEGWDAIGFDIERHDYGTGGYPGQLVLQDVCTVEGKQIAHADCIVASSPCQEFSYRAMPWKRAKALGPPVLGIKLFWQAFRLQREIEVATGRRVPLIAENVRGAVPWIGRPAWKYKTFFLWGDVPSLMPIPAAETKGFKGFKKNWRDCEASRSWSSHSARRKQWSAEIAMIPYPLAQHIARVYDPRSRETPVRDENHSTSLPVVELE